MTAYTGALTRAAHFAFRPPVPGINPEHEHPAPDPDPFTPVPPGADQGYPGDVWQPQDVSQQSPVQVGPRSHWAQLADPVPSGVHSWEADQAATDRMLANHSAVEYRPDSYVPYKHATQGLSIQFVDGRRPQAFSMEALQAGRNSYDFTNAPNEVYEGDRYRVGTEIQMRGRYEFWTKQGQDAQLRAYTGLEPAFPADKPRVPDSAPYTPNSSGTTTWIQDQFQRVSAFALPSETSVTDYEISTTPEAGGSSFDEGGRL